MGSQEQNQVSGGAWFIPQPGARLWTGLHPGEPPGKPTWTRGEVRGCRWGRGPRGAKRSQVGLCSLHRVWAGPRLGCQSGFARSPSTRCSHHGSPCARTPRGAEGLLWANVSQCPLLRTLHPRAGVTADPKEQGWAPHHVTRCRDAGSHSEAGRGEEGGRAGAPSGGRSCQQHVLRGVRPPEPVIAGAPWLL